MYYFTNVLLILYRLIEGMAIVGKKVYQNDAHFEHKLILEECGLKLLIPREVITPIESVYKGADQGLCSVVKFEFPEGSTLISAVCYVSMSSLSEFSQSVTVTVELVHGAHITD